MKRYKPIIFILFLFTTLLLKSIVFQFFSVGSNSMNNTLLKGDGIVINLLSYTFKTPNRVVVPIINHQFTIPSINFTHSDIEKGDLVVFRVKGFNKPIIKRCVALEGERVMFDNKILYVNGFTQPELDRYLIYKDSSVYSHDYLEEDIVPKDNGNRDFFKEIVVPAGKIFVCGDNRDFSLDSRYIGSIDKRWVVGKATMIYYPSELGSFKRIFNFLE
jgi:signal peptidase I